MSSVYESHAVCCRDCEEANMNLSVVLRTRWKVSQAHTCRAGCRFARERALAACGSVEDAFGIGFTYAPHHTT
jgi:hypothetical protein